MLSVNMPQHVMVLAVMRIRIKSGSGSDINNPDHNSESLETIFYG
jgi:hypothetical protein